MSLRYGAAAALMLVSLLPAVIPPGALAGSETYMLKRGSKVGPATEVKPTNCVTAADGSVTCDTKLVNPPGDTPAKPEINPFRN